MPYKLKDGLLCNYLIQQLKLPAIAMVRGASPEENIKPCVGWVRR
ncbi:MAG: hypothetical protein AB4426_25030 [Xenococcaceae cyanobacterium]